MALAEVQQLERDGRLAGYHHLPAIKAGLLRRLGRTDEARTAYRQALELASNQAGRDVLAWRLAAPGRPPSPETLLELPLLDSPDLALARREGFEFASSWSWGDAIPGRTLPSDSAFKSP